MAMVSMAYAASRRRSSADRDGAAVRDWLMGRAFLGWGWCWECQASCHGCLSHLSGRFGEAVLLAPPLLDVLL
jgi:hypothetical protein